jgi:hypothetical protein
MRFDSGFTVLRTAQQGMWMRKFLILAAAGACLAFPFSPLRAAPARDQEMRNLKQSHKQQWKSLKTQQRAEKNSLEQHPQSPESRKRFKQEMKEQRRLVAQVQKAETRGAKDGRSAAKHPGRPAKHREARGG